MVEKSFFALAFAQSWSLWGWSSSRSGFLSDLDELDVEAEGGVGRDAAGDALGAVALVGRDGQLGALPHRHLGQALLPPGDHLGNKQMLDDRPSSLGLLVSLPPPCRC